MTISWTVGTHALLLTALAAQAFLTPDHVQLFVQGFILIGICVQAAITILTHRWDVQDRARKQAELKASQEAIQREVVATTQLQLDTTKRAAEDVKSAVAGAHAPAARLRSFFRWKR